MAVGRRSFDGNSGIEAAVDHLLRQQPRLDRPLSSGAGGADAEVFQGPIDPTYLVAAVDARPEIRAVADFVCDGTDDHIEIQVALDELPSTGGRIQLSEGTFSFDTEGASNYHLQTPGAGNVTIAGVGHGTIIEMYGSAATYASMNGIALTGYCTLEDLTIDLSNVNTLANFYAITGNLKDRIRHVRFQNLNSGSGNYLGYINAGQFNLIEGCTFDDIARSGGPSTSNGVYGSTGTVVTGCTFTGGSALYECAAVDAPGGGMVVIGNTFSSCHVWTNGSRNSVVGNYFEDGGNLAHTMLRLEGNFITVTGNYFKGLGGRDGITCNTASAAAYVLFANNNIQGDMRFDNTNLHNWTIVGNHWYDGGIKSDTAAIAYEIQEVRIVGNSFGGFNFGGDSYIWFTGSDRVIVGLEITNNRVFTNDTGNLIDIDFDDDPASDFNGISILVNDNYLGVDEDTGSAGWAIRISGVTGAEHGGVQVCRNHLFNPGDGILIENCQQAIVRDNTVEFWGAAATVDNWACQLVVDGCVTAIVEGNSWRSALKGDDAGTGAAVYVQVSDSGAVRNNDVWGVVAGSLDTAIEVDGPALIEGNKYHGADPQYTGTEFTNEIVVTGTGAQLGVNYSEVDVSGATNPALELESFGAHEFAAGATNILVYHDMSETPGTVILTPYGDERIWVGTITSSSFTVHRSSGTNALSFGWIAKYESKALAPPMRGTGVAVSGGDGAL